MLTFAISGSSDVIDARKQIEVFIAGTATKGFFHGGIFIVKESKHPTNESR
jgi:hypothetical protein